MFQFSALRIIPFEYFTGLENMALDLFYAEQVSISNVPVLRFYGWNPYCLSMGRHQDLNSIDHVKLEKDKIDIVRRPTGGSAILHADELTYSFIIPKPKITHHYMYELFHQLLAMVLKNIGYDVTLSSSQKDSQYLNHDNSTFACFNRAAKSEIQFGGKKVVGSAQKIYKNSILQHGSIILGNEHEKIINYLRVSDEEKLKQKKLLKDNSTNLESINKSNILKNEIASGLTDAFSAGSDFPVFYKFPTNHEKKEAQKFNKQAIITNHIL